MSEKGPTALLISQLDKKNISIVGEYRGRRYKTIFLCEKCKGTFERTVETAVYNGCTKCRNANKIISHHDDHIKVDISTEKHPHAVLEISETDWSFLKTVIVGRVFPYRNKNNVYAAGWTGKKKKQIHNILLPDAKIVDHKDGNGLNNRRSNIRPCTHAQNIANSPAKNTNSLGIKGVSVIKESGKYAAFIWKNGKNINLGTFSTAHEAAEKFKAESIALHGSFAYESRALNQAVADGGKVKAKK